MKLKITPEPTRAEREAIAAALVQETQTHTEPWDEVDAGDCEEIVRP
ncbi:MAG TPA: hypothetical protein VGH82_02040 [Gaiellaceae bacterium]|jgi:hypothetical protein